jgi:hypothetical protein
LIVSGIHRSKISFRSMTTAHFSHLVFVDFENVPNVDLDAIEKLSAFVTLLIGKNQTKLDTALVMQIQRHPSKVRLIDVGGSGRNALDLTLAYYLGRAVIEAPAAELHIVSKDKDFEPLIAHLRRDGMKISRADSFGALSFLPAKKPAALLKKPVHRATIEAPENPDQAEAKLEKLIARLNNHAGPRPKRKKGLLSHISTAFGNRLNEAELLELADQLVARDVCKIDARDRVTY